MAILTNQTLIDLNKKMLGLGAPVQIDGQGYNKVDYSSMILYATNVKLTDYQANLIINTLNKYKNTQLRNYHDDIEETVAHYKHNDLMVSVVEFNEKVIRLSWTFNEEMSIALKTKLDKKKYSWNKIGGKWVLNVVWDYVPNIIEEFDKHWFNCSQIKAAQKEYIKLQSTQAQNQADNIQVQILPTTKLFVNRSSDVDTLEISFQYDPEIIDAIHTIPNAIWDKKNKLWKIKIWSAKNLYDAVPKSVNTEELKYWADLVGNWNHNYELIETSFTHKPYDFQIEDAKKLLKLKRGLNANEVGCGKTLEMIMIGESIPMKKLVIVPATLRLNWKREITMVNPSANVNIIYSDKEFKIVEGWNIISYNSLDKFQNQLEETKFQVIMIDEAHYIQAITAIGSPGSKRAKAVLRLAATAEYVYPITGTPKSSRNINLYNILRLIRHPLTIGYDAFREFGKKYCDAHQTIWGWDFSGNTNDKELAIHLKSVMVRHLKSEVLPGLKKQRQAIPVSVNLREYNKLIAEYMKKRNSSEGEKLALLNKAKQVVALQKIKYSIDFTKDLIESGEKVVIVTGYTDVVKAVETTFKNTCVKLVGGMSDKQKQEVITEFQNNSSTSVIVINIDAGGVGVTLTAASTMIINDLPWTTGQILQAEGRIWRTGQTKTAIIYFMMAVDCPMDEKLITTIVDKSQTINTVVDGGLGEEINLRKLIENVL